MDIFVHETVLKESSNFDAYDPSLVKEILDYWYEPELDSDDAYQYAQWRVAAEQAILNGEVWEDPVMGDRFYMDRVKSEWNGYQA